MPHVGIYLYCYLALLLTIVALFAVKGRSLLPLGGQTSKRLFSLAGILVVLSSAFSRKGPVPLVLWGEVH